MKICEDHFPGPEFLPLPHCLPCLWWFAHRWLFGLLDTFKSATFIQVYSLMSLSHSWHLKGTHFASEWGSNSAPFLSCFSIFPGDSSHCLDVECRIYISLWINFRCKVFQVLLVFEPFLTCPVALVMLFSMFITPQFGLLLDSNNYTERQIA